MVGSVSQALELFPGLEHAACAMFQPRLGISTDIVPRSSWPQLSCLYRIFTACYSTQNRRAAVKHRKSLQSGAASRSLSWRQGTSCCNAGLELGSGTARQTRADVSSMITLDRRTILRLLAVLIASSTIRPLSGQAADAMQGQRAFGISNDRFTVNGEPVRLLAGE